jgi:alpha-beta hydrolase superfamily lysophospholipase
MSNQSGFTFELAPDIAAFSWTVASPKAQLLLQHGLGEYSERYVEQYSQIVTQLNDLDIDVFAFDLPGHGRSDGERGLIDLQVGVWLHLQARELLASRNLPTVLYGHSLGGLITAGSINRNAANVAAAIIGSSALHLPSQGWERMLSQALGKLLPNAPMPLPRPGLEALSRDPEVVRKASVDPMFYQGKAKNLVAKSVIEVSDEIWGNTGNWKVPTLIMHGTADTSTDYKASVRLHEEIASVDKDLKIYEGAYHELLNDTIAEAATSDLLNWIKSRV